MIAGLQLSTETSTPAVTVGADMPTGPPPLVRVRGGDDSPRGAGSRAGSSEYRLETRPQPGPGVASGDALAAYTERAGDYDQRTDQFMVYRQRIVDALDVQPGDVVVDVGCGTGLCMPLLQERIGAAGMIVAIDESKAMLDIARARAAQFRWSNVTFIQAPAADADLPVDVDAALFCAVHDIVRCPESVANILSQLRPGARIASGGGKWAAPWLSLLNTHVAAMHRPYIRNFEGLDRPWSRLAPHVEDLSVTELAFGTGYVATARVPD
jgi:SAM-dependent methyltransferase